MRLKIISKEQTARLIEKGAKAWCLEGCEEGENTKQIWQTVAGQKPREWEGWSQ